ncbi:MAG: hypothetical protein IJB19_02120 [Clostridia bacterium]|nr:hypothetical protein [Clostridia bacterium]
MADIGIIGGADGPTAVLVASHFSWLWVGICVVAAAAVILAVVLYKKNK